MKAFSTLVITLGLMAATSAFAADTDRHQPTAAASSVSTLTRAEVRAEAVAALAQQRAIGYVAETGASLKPAPVAASPVTRAEVRAAAIEARSAQSFNDVRG